MRMDCADQFLDGRLEAQRDDRFGDELGGAQTDHVDAEHFVVLLVGDDLDEAVGLACDLRPSEHAERKGAGAHVVSAPRRFAFGQADAADFRIAVRATRHMIVVERTNGLAGDPLGGDDAFSRRHVRELRVRAAHRDDVADRRDALNAGAICGVDAHVSLLEIEPDAFGVQSGRHRPAAGRDEQVIGAQFFRRAVRLLKLKIDAVCRRFRRRDLRVRVARDPLPAKRLLQLFRHRLVFDRHEPREQLENRHVAAEPPENRRELDADRAASHDRDRFRHLTQGDRFVARNDASAIDLDAGNAPRRRTGRDDDLPARAQRLPVAFEDVDAAVAGQPRRAFDPVDPVLLEQELDAFGQTGDDAIFPRLHLRHVDRDARRAGARRSVADRDAPVFRVLHDLQRMRMLEQRLGRNAAHQQARAAERFLFFDDGRFQTELRGANGGDVAARPRTDDDDVVVGHRLSDESGTNAVVPAGRDASDGVTGSGSIRLRRARSWPCS